MKRPEGSPGRWSAPVSGSSRQRKDARLGFCPESSAHFAEPLKQFTHRNLLSDAQKHRADRTIPRSFVYTVTMNDAYDWYLQLAKPTWAPPQWIFGPAWSVLYVLIAASFGAVFLLALTKKIPARVALPFAINLIANLAFSPIQFQLRSNELAAVDILVVLATIVWSMKAVWPHRRWIAFAQLPYLAWVSFATVLQLTVTYLNYGR
jgi:benzodiazapine receptor